MCRMLSCFILFCIILVTRQTASGQASACLYFDNYYKAVDLASRGYIHQADSVYRGVFSSDWGDLMFTYNTLDWAVRFGLFDLQTILFEHAARKGESFQVLQSWIANRHLDAEIINETVYYRLRQDYKKQLDELMIKELLDMAEKDQFVRSSKELYQSDYQMLVDKTNAFRLQELIQYNKGLFPAYHQIGKEGYEALITILYHLNINTLSDILPSITEAIQRNHFFRHEVVLYQIDRNIIGSANVYLYDTASGKLVKGPANAEIPNYGYHQYYGSVSTFDPVSQKKYTDPVFPERDKNVVLSLYAALCYPEKNPLRAEERPSDKDSFMSIFGLKNK